MTAVVRLFSFSVCLGLWPSLSEWGNEREGVGGDCLFFCRAWIKRDIRWFKETADSLAKLICLQSLWCRMNMVLWSLCVTPQFATFTQFNKSPHQNGGFAWSHSYHKLFSEPHCYYPYSNKLICTFSSRPGSNQGQLQSLIVCPINKHSV